MERRERDRVNVKLKCRVDWPGQPLAWQGGETENISRTGVLIRWRPTRTSTPAVGDPVLIRLQMPLNPAAGQRWMSFCGCVVRVSHADNESLRIAVSGEPIRSSGSPKRSQPVREYVN